MDKKEIDRWIATRVKDNHSKGRCDIELDDVYELLEAIDDDIDIFYNNLIIYLENEQHKAKSWEAHCALQEVIEYLEGKGQL